MKVVKATEQIIVKVMCALEAEKEKSLYYAVRRAAEAIGQNPDSLPEELLDGMYDAATDAAREGLTSLCIDGTKMLMAAFAAVEGLPENPTAAQIKKLQKQADKAMLPLLFMTSILKAVTDDVDYEYLGEQMFEASRAAVKKREQATASL